MCTQQTKWHTACIKTEDNGASNLSKWGMLTDFHKEASHVERRLGRGLEKDDVVLLRVLLSLLRLHFPLAFHIRLVAGQRYYYVGISAALQLLNPRLGSVERVLHNWDRNRSKY